MDTTTFAKWYECQLFGRLYLTSTETALTGVFFETHQKYWGPTENDVLVDSLPILDQACEWLDVYFEGKDPGALPPIDLGILSPFRRMVCEEMTRIPYGQLVTYGDIAKSIGKRLGKEKMSARAVGGGVGHNPIGIIIPCHRVIGANKSLTGYGGGMFRKVALLELEGIDLSGYTIPTKGTAI